MIPSICLVNSVAIRKEPSFESEMTSQLLFGETFQVLKQIKKWAYIRCDVDNFEGWLLKDQCSALSEKAYANLRLKDQILAFDLFSTIITEARHIPVIAGSILPNFDGLSFSIDHMKGIYNGQVISPNPLEPNLEHLSKIIFKYLDAPHFWGGRSPFGIDATGFVQKVLQFCGYQLPRKLNQQIQCGKLVHLISAVQPGDVAFFENENGINHVGIFLKPNMVAHCHSKVQLQQIDTHGIFDKQQNQYTHKLKMIRRMVV